MYYEELKNKVGKYKQLEIKVDYDLGGMNFFSGETRERAFKLYITPCHKGERTVEKIMLGEPEVMGYYVTLEPVKRFNKKKQEKWEEAVKPITKEIADLYSDSKHKEIYNLVLQLKEQQ